jgi:hypothetical protein
MLELSVSNVPGAALPCTPVTFLVTPPQKAVFDCQWNFPGWCFQLQDLGHQ